MLINLTCFFFQITEAGSEVLPTWLYFNSSSHELLGVPSALEQGALAIEVTAVHHANHNTTHEHVASNHFIIQVLTSNDNHILWSLDTNAAKLQVANQHVPSTLLKLNKCMLGQTIYQAAIVIDADFARFSAKQRVKVLYKLANFISRSVHDISLFSRKSEAVSRLLDQRILYTGPGNANVTSKNAGVELTWILGCGDFIEQLSDFVKVLEHNVQSNRISSELDLDIIGWQVMETQPPEQIKKLHRQRRQVMHTPIPTPTVYSILPSAIKTSAHQAVLTETVSEILPTSVVSEGFGDQSTQSPEYSQNEQMSSSATMLELSTSFTTTQTLATKTSSLPIIHDFSKSESIDILSPSLSEDFKSPYSTMKDIYTTTEVVPSFSVTEEKLPSSTSIYVPSVLSESSSEVTVITSGELFTLPDSMTFIPTMTSFVMTNTQIFMEPSSVIETDSDVMPTTNSSSIIVPSLTDSQTSLDLGLDVSVWSSVVSPSPTLMETSSVASTVSPRDETMSSTPPNVTTFPVPSSNIVPEITSPLQSEYGKTSSVYTTHGIYKSTLVPSDLPSESQDNSGGVALTSEVIGSSESFRVNPTSTTSQSIEKTSSSSDLFTFSHLELFPPTSALHSSHTQEHEASSSWHASVTTELSVSVTTKSPALSSVFTSYVSQVLEPSQVPLSNSMSVVLEPSQFSSSTATNEPPSFVAYDESSTIISQAPSEWIYPTSELDMTMSQEFPHSSADLSPTFGIHSSAIDIEKSVPVSIESSLNLHMPSFTYSTPLLPSDMIMQSPSDEVYFMSMSSTTDLATVEFSSHVSMPNKTLVGPPRTTVVSFLTPDISSSQWEDIYASAGLERSEELFTKVTESLRSQSVTPAVSEQLVTSTQTLVVIGSTPSVMVTKDTASSPVTATSKMGLETPTSPPKSSTQSSRSTPAGADTSTVYNKWQTTTGLYV